MAGGVPPTPGHGPSWGEMMAVYITYVGISCDHERDGRWKVALCDSDVINKSVIFEANANPRAIPCSYV